MKIGIFCAILGAVLISLSLHFMRLCRTKDDVTGKRLWRAFLICIPVIASYLISIQMKAKMPFAIFSSIYYCCISMLCYNIMLFAADFAGLKWKSKISVVMRKALFILGAFDVFAEATNPYFNYYAVEFVKSSSGFPAFEYSFKPLYIFHLIYCYVLLVLYVGLMIYKALRVPKGYRLQYLLAIAGLFGIVFINALFLYLPKDSVYTRLDYSIVGYEIVATFMYWTKYTYATEGMMSKFKNYVFSNIEQGIILFDFEDNMILWNERAKVLIPNLDFKRDTVLNAFTDRCSIEIDKSLPSDNRTFQCYVRNENDMHALRCDYRTVHNEDNALLGRLFVFSDVTLDTDRLTGYHSWDRFRFYIKENPKSFELPAIVCACDINGLTTINSAFGREAGDRKIQELASNLKSRFLKNSYFVRGPEANLIVITYNRTRDSLIETLKDLEKELDISIQYAIAETAPDDPSVYPAIQNALCAVKNRKLLDSTSSHSGTLSSLIAALQAGDNDTEAHVQRTRRIGLALGKKLGLSDLEQSQLSLLCLMHDIGKIGIPLEILNKPTKLSEAEFRVMRSHVRKGYEICKSSPELNDIAEMVLHHHERWDGRGYPDGQSKETIPLLSRIICVIDAYDAMVSKRVYSTPLTEEAAQKEILDCAGKQFDPTIASALVRLVKEKSFYADNRTVSTSNEEAEKRIAEHREPTWSSVFEVNYASYVVDSSMHIIQIDEGFKSLTGYTEDDIKDGKLTQFDLIPMDDRAEYAYSLNHHEGEQSQAFLEHRIVTKNGLFIYVYCFGQNFFDPVAKDMYTRIIIADALETHSLQILMKRERDKSIKRLEVWEDSYRRDPMTSLLNREAFRSDVDLQLLDATQKVLMLMIDVDKFKEYNDTYGHHAGDEFLVTLAHALKDTMRSGDLACRMGGDEFAAAVVFPINADANQIYARAEQIFNNIQDAIHRSGLKGTFSMGAVIAEPGTSFMDIYDSSDSALYQSKNAGRGRLTIAGKK